MEAVGTSSGTNLQPISLEAFEEMKRSAAFTDEDVRYLRMSHDVLKDQVEEILDTWYGFFGSNPHLLATFSTPDGKPIQEYLSAVRTRFGQWILETAKARYDESWLAKQLEIGLRHHRSKKNRTDRAKAMDVVPFRHLFPTVYPVTATLRPFLTKKGNSAEEIDKMHAAWIKSCLLQLTLWSQPYIRPEDF